MGESVKKKVATSCTYNLFLKIINLHACTCGYEVQKDDFQNVDNDYLKMDISSNSDDFYFPPHFYIFYSEHV